MATNFVGIQGTTPTPPKPSISNGVLGFLGVNSNQYDQARKLYDAGVTSFNNADRLSYLSPEAMAKRQTAGNAGLTFLNGEAIAPGAAGIQNQNTPGFTSGTFGGVQAGQIPAPSQSPDASQTSTSAMVDALRQQPLRFGGYGLGINSLAGSSPSSQTANQVNTLQQNKTPNGLFQSI